MLFESARSRRIINCLVSLLQECEPGHCVEVTRDFLFNIDSDYYNGAMFAPPDRVLENIIGAAYEWSYQINPISGNVIFMRAIKPDYEKRTYISPDRRSSHEQ